MAAAAVLEHQSEPADTSDDGLYEFVLNSDGSTTKITHKNSKGRRCKKCGCRCLCSCKDCKPFCCSSYYFQNKTSTMSIQYWIVNTSPLLKVYLRIMQALPCYEGGSCMNPHSAICVKTTRIATVGRNLFRYASLQVPSSSRPLLRTRELFTSGQEALSGGCSITCIDTKELIVRYARIISIF